MRGDGKMEIRCKHCKSVFSTTEDMRGRLEKCPICTRWFYVRSGLKRGRSPYKFSPEEIAQLGTDIDGVVARNIGVSRSLVEKKRRELNIEIFGKRGRPLIEWSEEHIALLGRITDRELSNIKGVSVTLVCRKRAELEIPAKCREPYIKIRTSIPKEEMCRRCSYYLTQRNRTIVNLRKKGGLRLGEIGVAFGISRQQVHNITK